MDILRFSFWAGFSGGFTPPKSTPEEGVRARPSLVQDSKLNFRLVAFQIGNLRCAEVPYLKSNSPFIDH